MNNLLLVSLGFDAGAISSVQGEELVIKNPCTESLPSLRQTVERGKELYRLLTTYGYFFPEDGIEPRPISVFDNKGVSHKILIETPSTNHRVIIHRTVADEIEPGYYYAFVQLDPKGLHTSCELALISPDSCVKITSVEEPLLIANLILDECQCFLEGLGSS
ncbi:hypothetical protein GW755_00375 [bacterium]|nr:hypothetical protein [bacterium]